MAASPFAFLRGTAHLFYARIPGDAPIVRGPRTWLCGDAHLDNVGTFKAEDRLVFFDLNDFDEAALGPALLDLTRLCTSLFVAASGAIDAESLVRTVVTSYARALVGGKGLWVDRDAATGEIATLLAGASRSQTQLLDSRTVKANGKRRIDVRGKHALPASAEEVARARAIVASFAQTRAHPERFAVLDVARRIAGNGSLGVERYVVLVSGHDEPALIDIKRAGAPATHLVAGVSTGPFTDDAQRVVGVQRRMQAVSPALLSAVHEGDASYVLRELQPSEDRLDWDDRATLADADNVVTTIASVLAWAQLRSGGRDGSAIADELIAFGDAAHAWSDGVIAYARAEAGRVRADWEAFRGSTLV